MKFAHLADMHIGGWREDRLNLASLKAFKRSVEIAIEQNVDFILLAGDLFNTALPPIDQLKEVVRILKYLKDENVPVYLIPGSHDFSSSGKTMIDVLESAGLIINVSKGDEVNGKLRLRFVKDSKTGAKITGIGGKKGQLERTFYEALDRDYLESESGFKIFMFHTSISELKPKHLEKIEAQPLSLLPKGFNYYAGGHIHIVKNVNLDGYSNVVYPGPTFPNDFRELEMLGCGGFYLFDDGRLEYIPVEIFKHKHILINAHNKSPLQITNELKEHAKGDLNNTIITIRVEGKVRDGKPTDINFREIFEDFYSLGAQIVLKNTSKLQSKEFEEVKLEAKSADEAESSVIKEHLGQSNLFDQKKEEEFVNILMNVCNTEKRDGETKTTFEQRLISELNLYLLNS